MDFSRFKAYDFGVIGLFILTIIGVSLSWYTVSLSVGSESLAEASASGWERSLGALAFVMALVALFWVGLKAVLSVRGRLPYWYLEGLVLVVVGVLIALFAVICIIDKPGGGDFVGLDVGYGPGIFVTLGAGLLVAGCGYVAMRDGSLTSSGATWTPAGPGPVEAAGRGGRFCRNCGAQLDPEARFCRSCGKAQ